jgi:membrane protein required for colicin V production
VNPLDAGALVIILVFAIRCAFRGIVQEVMTMAAFIAGGLAAFLFWRPLSILLSSLIPLAYLPQALAIILAFGLVFLLVKLVERAIIETMEALHLGAVDHVLGFVLGIVEGVLVSAAFVALISFQPVWNPAPLFSSSLFYRLVSPFMDFERILSHVR